MSKLSKKLSKMLNPSAPRPMKEIQQEYNELSTIASQAQYQVYVYSRSLQETNEKMLKVNQEAAERSNLDRQAALQEQKEKEAANVKS